MASDRRFISSAMRNLDDSDISIPVESQAAIEDEMIRHLSPVNRRVDTAKSISSVLDRILERGKREGKLFRRSVKRRRKH